MKNKIITAPCKRGCGKNLSSLSRSTWGLDELKEKYEFICHDCMTRKERFELLDQMSKQIIKK